MTRRSAVTPGLSDLDPSWLSVPAGVLAAAAVLLSAPLSGEASTMVAIAVFCVSLWVGTPVPPWFTALVGVGLIGVAFSTELALVGFASGATWLIVLGVLVGEATSASGLAGVAERWTLRRVPGTADGDAVAVYRRLLGVLSLVALAFAVLVPSSLVRVLVLGPVLVSIGDLFEERRPKLGLFLGPLFVTYYGASGVLTGSLANIIIAGLVESTAGVSIGWLEWLAWMGPVMGVGRLLAVVVVADLLYRPREADGVAPPSAYGDAVDVPEDARRMLGFLLLGVVIWATDAVHGLHPLYGALVVALLAFAPRIGVVGPDAVSDVDFSIVFFVGAVFAIAEGLRRTGFSDRAARAILAVLPGDAALPVVLGVVVVAAAALALLMEGLAVASVLTPVLVSFASSVGVPVVPVAMVEAVALNSYFFPYQSAVLVAILGMDVVDSRELVRMATTCTVVTFAVLLPVQIAVFVVLF